MSAATRSTFRFPRLLELYIAWVDMLLSLYLAAAAATAILVLEVDFDFGNIGREKLG